MCLCRHFLWQENEAGLLDRRLWLKKNAKKRLYYIESYTAVERCYSGASMRVRLTLNPQFPEKVCTPVPRNQDGGSEDIISYLRDYIAICKEKKDSFFVSLYYWSLKIWKDTNESEDEQNKQMNFPQCHHGFVGFAGSQHSPLSRKASHSKSKQPVLSSPCFVKSFISYFSKQRASLYSNWCFFSPDQILNWEFGEEKNMLCSRQLFFFFSEHLFLDDQ